VVYPSKKTLEFCCAQHNSPYHTRIISKSSPSSINARNPCIRSPTYPALSSNIPHSIYTLPLRFLSIQEALQNRNNPLQRRQPRPQLTLHLLLIALAAKLRVKVFTIRTCAHRGAEDRLHHEGVVRFEGAAVRGAEGCRELFGGSGEVLGERYRGEV
jgi:hypothetical protein